MDWQWFLPTGWRPWAHQVEVFEWAKDRLQAALFLDMGLGKTYTAINVYQRHIEEGRLDCVIIVSLLSSLESVWMEALEKSRVPGKAVNVSEDKLRANRIANLATPAQWYVMNYDAACGLQEQLEEKIKACKGRVGIIVDESSNIKNPSTQRCKTMVNLAKLQDYRMILNGTPLAQGPMDIFGQYKFLDKSIFGPLKGQFQAHFMQMGGYMGRKVLGLYVNKEAEFNKLMYSCAVRKTKAECLDLPPKVYEKRSFELGPEERQIYDQMSHKWVMLVKDEVVAAQQGVVRSMRLAQITTGFYDDEEHWEVEKPSKIKALLEVIEELPKDSKFIIWCAWKKNIVMVMKALEEAGIKAVDYYGDTEGGAEQRHVNEMAFRNDDSVRAFVGTAASGSASLNLQGPLVQTVIYYSQQYSNYQRQQSEDRCYRGEIKHTVTVVDLVAKGTVEASIVRALRQGKDLQEYLLRDPEQFVLGKLTMEREHA